jgi:ABC-type nitrate/sulfonate/bicarbonate transport system substrate-binding protein
MIRKGAISTILGLMLFAMTGVSPSSAAPLTIGYSDWPGRVAWQVAIDKGCFKEAGVDVTFQWFDYSASMDAFAAGKIDGNLMTNGDTLVTGAGGGKGIMIMLTDYSNGNDIIVGKPGTKTLKDLKGKKIGIAPAALRLFRRQRAAGADARRGEGAQIARQPGSTGSLTLVSRSQPSFSSLMDWIATASASASRAGSAWNPAT